MSENEIITYYDENWNDYNKIVDMLHNMIDAHTEELNELKKVKDSQGLKQEVIELQRQLLNCQDRLDEETHQL